MGIGRRERVEHVPAEGFLAEEARALATAVREAVRDRGPAPGAPVPVELTVERGAGDRLVVVCRNLVVGFVPASAAVPLTSVLAGAGKRARVVVPGTVHDDAGVWRVWVGPLPDGGLPGVPDDADRLPPKEPTIVGIPLRRPPGPPPRGDEHPVRRRSAPRD